jgi:predicted outer membrane repeat protein
MNQLRLLLWACRRPLMYAVALGIMLSVAALLLLAVPFGIADPEGSLFSDIVRILANHATAFTLYAAGLAAYCHIIAGLPSALTRLPVPVTARQQTYVPLAFALIHWGLLLLAGAALLAAGGSFADGPRAMGTLADAAWGLPLGLFVIALVNREAGDQLRVQFMANVHIFYPMLLMTDNDTPSVALPVLQDLNTFCAPLIATGALLFIIESPRHRQNWLRAAFIPFRAPIGNRCFREPLAPQRFNYLTFVAEFLSSLVLVGSSAFPLFATIGLYKTLLWGGGRLSFEAELLTRVLALALLVVAILHFAYMNGLLRLSSGKWLCETASAQRFLRAGRWFEFTITRRQLIPGKLIRRSNETGHYNLPCQAIHNPAPETETSNPRTLQPAFYFWLIFCLLLYMGVMIGSTLRATVNYDRIGSNIDGDALARPEETYSVDGAFAQHYIALDLGEKTPPEKLDEAFGVIQTLVAQSAGPIVWLEGLKTLDGANARAPEKYRIEIARPEPHVVVIQSIGLHWDPPGQLAYALARHILNALPDSWPATLDDQYAFYRHSGTFLLPYGFLDNSVHWIRPEIEVENDEGYAPAPLPGDTPVFVDLRKTDLRENGKSWATAYDTIQEGIDAAYRRRVAGVWVAGGIYDEERYGDGALYMRSGVHIYGGFAGDETIRTQRNLDANPTWIDGSIARNGEAAYHVVVGASYATLDGFTITGGNANSDSGFWNDSGGGLYAKDASPVVSNCHFVGNSAKRSGGAIYLYGGSITLENSHFDGNTSGEDGGAIAVGKGELLVLRCTLTGNSAAENGDAIYAYGGTLVAEDSLIVHNGDSTSTGSIILGRELTLRNCTLVGNGDSGPPLFDGLNDLASIFNTIVWNAGEDYSGSEATIVHSIIPGGHPGEGNLDADPLFVDPEGGDYRLQPGSPAIDAGTMEGAPSEDLDGNPRPLGPGIDIGAYEHASESP